MPAKLFTVFVAGLPGSGKSYFAEKFSRKIHAVHLNSDRVRKELFPVRKYTPAEKQAVYDALLAQMSTALRAGKNVVLDATFHRSETRDYFEKALRDLGIPPLWIQVIADEKLIRQRVEKPREFSEADFDVYQKVRDEADPMDRSHLELYSTNENIEEMIKLAKAYITSNL